MAIPRQRRKVALGQLVSANMRSHARRLDQGAVFTGCACIVLAKPVLRESEVAEEVAPANAQGSVSISRAWRLIY